jgi:hypothetical protein
MKKSLFGLGILVLFAFGVACEDSTSDVDGLNCGAGTMLGDGGVCVTACSEGQSWDGTSCIAAGDCGPGTVAEDGSCVPLCDSDETWVDGGCASAPDCDPGTVYDSDEGACVPSDDLCGEGTHSVDGGCTPDLECGDGTHLEDNGCVLDDPATEIPESEEPGVPAEFDLPEDGASVELTGVVDTPEDFNGDGYVDGDFDIFRFDAPAGTWLEIVANTSGVAQPAFIVESDTTDDGGGPLYRRVALCPGAVTCRREVYRPRDDTYYVILSDFTQVDAYMFQYGTFPAGGPDFTYSAVVRNLGVPTPNPVDALPHTTSTDIDGGSLIFTELANLPADTLTEVISAGVPQAGIESEVYPALLLLDTFGALVDEQVIGQAWDSAALVLDNTGNGSWLVEDHFMTIGSNQTLKLDVRALAATQCDGDACDEALPVTEDESLLASWSLSAGQFLVIGSYCPMDGNTMVYQQLLKEDGTPISEVAMAHPKQVGSQYVYAQEDMTVLLWTRYGDGDSTTDLQIETKIIDTPSLMAGQTYADLAVNEMPPYTLRPAAIEHFQNQAGKMVFFSDFVTHDGATGGWQFPMESIMTQRLETIGPVIDTNSWLFPDSYCTPLFGYIPNDDHYLHYVYDGGGDILDSTYDVRMAYYNVPEVKQPAVGDPTVRPNQSLSGMGFYAFEALRHQYIEITVTPTALSRIQPKLWVLNFGAAEVVWISYAWIGDPTSHQLGLVIDEVAQAQGDALKVGYTSPYDGKTILLVMDDGGAATTIDLFNLRLEVPPPPANDMCADAETITFSGDTAPVSGTSIGATDSELQPMCTAWITPGPEVYYSLELDADDELTVTADSTAFSPVLYLFTDCDDPVESCVAGTTADELLSVTYTVPSDGAGTYFLAVDSSRGGGDFTLDLTKGGAK